MNIFERTRQKREQDAGTQEKPKAEPRKDTGKTMSQADFSGYGSSRPAQSKKWTEK